VASERQSPDAILASTNLTGSVGDLQDDPDSPDSNWLTATSDGSDTMLRVSFPTPSGNPTSGAGLQEFRWWVRNTSNGGGSDPTYVVHLYENGSDLGQIASGSVASGTGEILSATWNANLLGTSDGSLVEAYIYGTVVKKDSLEIGAAEWNVTYNSGTVVEGEGQSDGTSTATGTGSVEYSGVGQADGTSTATATATVEYSGVGQADGASTATGSASVEHIGAGQADGTSTATGSVTVEYAGTGQSDGTSTATGTGEVSGAVEGEGQSDGASTAAGTATVTYTGTGQADGTSTAAATALVEFTGAGQSAGASTAAATAVVEYAGVGQSDGTSSASADGYVEYSGMGQSDGSSLVAGIGRMLPNIRDLLGLCTTAAEWAEPYGADWATAWGESVNGAWLIWTVTFLGMDRSDVIAHLQACDSGITQERIDSLTSSVLMDCEWAALVSNSILERLLGLTPQQKADALAEDADIMRSRVTALSLEEHVEDFLLSGTGRAIGESSATGDGVVV
jgi:hypothetical protein